MSNTDPVPDALERHVTRRQQRGHNIQITFMVPPALRDQLDAAARRHHVSRSTLMTWWLGDRLAQEPAP